MKTLNVTRIILLSAVLAIASPAYAQSEEAPIVKLHNEMMQKPEHHLAIAVYFRTLADEARANVETHKAMGKTYQHNHSKFKSGVAAGESYTKHCDRLIQLFQSTAEEYEALAKLHDAEATQK